jgi:hypothetical protein
MSPTSTARDRAQDFRRVAVKLAIRPRNCWASTNCWLLPGELLRAERVGREPRGVSRQVLATRRLIVSGSFGSLGPY